MRKPLKTEYISNFLVRDIKIGTSIRTDATKIKGLAQSMKHYGLINPIVIDENSIVVMGKRRLLAARKQKFRRVPVMRINSEDKLALQLIENLQREDLNPIDKAKAFKAFRDSSKMSIREMGLSLGVSHSTIERHLNLLLLPKPVQGRIYDGRIHPFYNQECKTMVNKIKAGTTQEYDFIRPAMKSIKYRLKSVKRTLREKPLELADLLIVKAETVEILNLVDIMIRKAEKDAKNDNVQKNPD